MKVQASKKKGKADNLDDSTPEKLQRVTDDKSLCGSCHKDVARLCKQNVMIVTSGITMFVLVLGPVMLNCLPG